MVIKINNVRYVFKMAFKINHPNHNVLKHYSIVMLIRNTMTQNRYGLNNKIPDENNYRFY